MSKTIKNKRQHKYTNKYNKKNNKKNKKKSRKINKKKINLSKKNNKGGHKYTRRLLELTSRTPIKEEFVSKENVDNYIKKNIPKINKSNIKSYTPSILKDNKSELNDLELNDLELNNLELNNQEYNIDKLRGIQSSSRNPQNIIEQYKKKLEKENLSKKEYDKKVDKFIIDRFSTLGDSDFNRQHNQKIMEEFIKKSNDIDNRIEQINKSDTQKKNFIIINKIIQKKMVNRLKPKVSELERNTSLNEEQKKEKFINLLKDLQREYANKAFIFGTKNKDELKNTDIINSAKFKEFIETL